MIYRKLTLLSLILCCAIPGSCKQKSDDTQSPAIETDDNKPSDSPPQKPTATPQIQALDAEYQENVNHLKKILQEVEKDKNTILFLDEIHTIVGAGSTSGSMDASNLLKPALARGEIQCIGATTLNEYRTSIEKDGALERRFQKVMINQPSVAETIKILEGLREKYEEHHKVRYTLESLTLAANLAKRYITDRFMPDKAIDVIDEAGARKHLQLKIPEVISKTEIKIEDLDSQKEKLIVSQKFEEAAKVRDQLKKLNKKLATEQTKWQEKYQNDYLTIDENDINDVVSMMSSVPISKLATSESKKLQRLAKELAQNIFGQDEAINSVVRRIKRARAGFKDPNRPIGSFLFLGPTGVGKTELAKVIARELFESEDSLIKVDMSEYMEKFNASKMIGSPPGYVGYEEGGQLSEKVRRRPYSVVLFDEIEKAHQDVYNLLLQVLDEGTLTDGNGRKIDFKNTIIIFTSNIGTGAMSNTESIGFGTEAKKATIVTERIQKGVKSFFKPEFLNRIDETIIFNSLSDKAAYKIVNKEIEIAAEKLLANDLLLKVTAPAKRHIVKNHYNKEEGARSLKRAVETVIEDPIAEKIIQQEFEYNSHITVSIKNHELSYESKLHLEKDFSKIAGSSKSLTSRKYDPWDDLDDDLDEIFSPMPFD